MKKTININFVGLPQKIPYHELLMYKLLSERYNVVIKEKPDYLFVGVNELYDFCSFEGVRILYPFELFLPDLNIFDYAFCFSNEIKSDRVCHLFPPLQLNYIRNLSEKRKYSLINLKEKTGFCNYVYSHMGMPERKEIFNVLSKYKKVDSAGKYLNNMDGFTPGDRASIAASYANESKIIFQKNYKFSIAFENASYRDYNTEKLTDAFYAGTIPIYYGDPLVGEVYNEDAFINCHRFNSFDEVLEVVKEIDTHDELLLKMLNEPVFNDPLYVDKHLELVKQFLFNIFDQPYEEAFRRPCFLYPQTHENYLKEYSKIKNSVSYKIKKRIAKSMSNRNMTK